MSVNESGMGQCECESRHATHSLHESGNARRCQRAATKIMPSLWAKPGETLDRPGSYVCMECAIYHENLAALASTERTRGET